MLWTIYPHISFFSSFFIDKFYILACCFSQLFLMPLSPSWLTLLAYFVLNWNTPFNSHFFSYWQVRARIVNFFNVFTVVHNWPSVQNVTVFIISFFGIYSSLLRCMYCTSKCYHLSYNRVNNIVSLKVIYFQYFNQALINLYTNICLNLSGINTLEFAQDYYPLILNQACFSGSKRNI